MNQQYFVFIAAFLLGVLMFSGCITVNQYPTSTPAPASSPAPAPASNQTPASVSPKAPVPTLPPAPTPTNAEAAATELASIKAAVFSMMIDNNLSRLNITRDASNATADMSIFPGGAYVLYGNKVKGTTINYVAAQMTKGTYAVDALGTVTQVTTGY